MRQSAEFPGATAKALALPSLAAAIFAGATVTLAQASDPIDSSPRDNPSLVARPSDIASGKLVQSPQGTVIGAVHEVISEPASGRPAYVLISTDSGATAIPYWAIGHLIRDAHIVIDRSTLAEAPRIPGSGAPKDGDTSWKARADSYWNAYR
jgi:hypothetical protein